MSPLGVPYNNTEALCYYQEASSQLLKTPFYFFEASEDLHKASKGLLEAPRDV